MPAPSVLKRIERAEEAAKAQSRFSPDCICFPENEPPFFAWPIEQELAAKLKCPLHGDRFKPRFFVYVSKWIREKLPGALLNRKSAQYGKAWFASFPPELWPAEEVVTAGGVSLRLKDGAVLRTG